MALADFGRPVPTSGPRTEEPSITASVRELKQLRDELQRFLIEYQFAMREVETKISILRDEFQLMHDYNPIEHVSSRVKTPDSLVEKVLRRGIEPDTASIREHITDIAGVRITCSFVADAYRLFDLLTQQDDIRVRIVKDYIATPKENGYQSLHAILDVPVFLSSGRIDIPVEVQFRTIAMDFWASLEHKIYYKYDRAVPAELLAELREAADAAAELDTRMERLHRQIRGGAVEVREDELRVDEVAVTELDALRVAVDATASVTEGEIVRTGSETPASTPPRRSTRSTRI